MKRLLIIGMTVAALAVSAVSPAAAKSPTSEPRFTAEDLPNPLAEKQSALKQAAQAAVLSGEATPQGDNKVVKVAKGQFVELAFEGEDLILSLLGEFGNMIHPSYGGAPGPLHNQIPEPDRDLDNTTLWAPDFNVAHYEDLLYNKALRPSMANFYLEASSGTYSVNGDVGDWVTVPYNEARYGTNACGGIVCNTVWRFVNDESDAWWNNLVAETGSVANANAWLAQYDVWDRYDADGDGEFDEADGYIDHFQAIHAGEGEETGGGAQGANAIWSHRWYAWYPGTVSPDGAGPNGFGGARIGASDFWVGDYTVEPENGGVGVFAHEFGHDLYLPDEYDTSGNTGGAENSTGWWTTWSQGSYGSINNEGIGNYPVSMTAWERLQLGFLHNYAVAGAGQSGTYELGPIERNNKKASALFVVLPDKEVTEELGAPYAGANFYYSGAADSLDTTMTRNVTLPAGASLTAKVRYNIEAGYDFAYLMVDGDLVTTNLSNGTAGVAEGIEGVSPGQPAWVDLTADLSAYTGAHDITFGYYTDGGVQGQTQSLPAGIAIDEIAITGQPTDGAETDAGWAFDSNNPDQGFHVTTGTETFEFFNAYVVENRTYLGYDLALQKGPYNFGFPTMPDWVEHFPLQDGVLIWYWDSSYSDNNVGDHPGEGLILPVDSHPQIETWTEGTQMRPRIQSYDSTFTKTSTQAITLHNPATGVAKTITSKPANSVFNDALRDGDGTSIYWMPGHASDAPGTSRYQAEWNSVNVPDTGTRIQVKSISGTGIAVIDLNK